MTRSIDVRRVVTLVLASLMGMVPVSITAQTPQVPAQAPSAQTQFPERAPWNPESFGVSLERIKRGLAEAPPTGRKSIIQLAYHVEVVGRAPKFDLFSGVNVGDAPVQYGGMTHQEFLQVVRPKEFSAPSASLVSLAVMAAQAVAGLAKGEKKDKRK
jgi:hypothetical protein